jgi:hypothetical protein
MYDVKIIRSPDRKKKFRAILGDGRTVDFGAYVLRHGGRVPRRTTAERDPKKIQTLMLSVNSSDKEDWKISGIDGAGFWSRWYLWSYPDFESVKKFMSRRFGIKFVN